MPGDAVEATVSRGRWFTIHQRETTGRSGGTSSRGEQAVIVVSDARARQRFRFDVSLSRGARLKLVDGALVAVDSRGSAAGVVTAPWAIDSAGSRISTRFEIVDRDSFVQVVATAMPVPRIR